MFFLHWDHIKKRGRGPNSGIDLSRQVEKNGKLDILIPDVINKPIGESYTKLPREIVFLARSIAITRVANWSEVEVDQKKKIIKTLLVDIYLVHCALFFNFIVHMELQYIIFFMIITSFFFVFNYIVYYFTKG